MFGCDTTSRRRLKLQHIFTNQRTMAHHAAMKRRASFLAAVAFLLGLLVSVGAFINRCHSCSCSRPNDNRKTTNIAGEMIRPSWHRLYAEISGGGGKYGNIPASSGDWQLYNSFEQFLNQCAIQSLLFLINSLKDRHTALWLEDFTQPVIHTRTKEGTGRDQVLTNMATALNEAMHETQMERPIRLLSYHGLGAINTTLFPTWDVYFQKLLQQPIAEYSIESSRPHVPTYTLDIVPASLCSRLISVREQIAREFANDLDVIAESSLTAMGKYRQNNNGNNNNNQLERIHPYFLELSVHEDYLPSPLRKGNFDLLLSLTTQEAIHRILNQLDNDNNNIDHQSSVQFLRNFYSQRVGTHFTGSNFYGRADDFLDELLGTLPSVVQLQDSECGLVDPEQLVELIFQVRTRRMDASKVLMRFFLVFVLSLLPNLLISPFSRITRNEKTFHPSGSRLRWTFRNLTRPSSGGN
jgi:hypothetical protein